MSEALKTRIQEVLAQPQLSVLATMTADGKPWCRYVMTVADADMNLRCASFVGARKVQQIEANPEVHVTRGIANPAEMKPYVQIQGRARFTTDHDERHGFWSGMLAAIFSGPDDPNYGVVVIEPYRIEYCTLGSHEPEVWER